MVKLSKRALNLSPSETLAAGARAKRLKAEGFDVKGLTLGEPDFATPENVQKAAIEAIHSGVASYYTETPGILPLRQAIQKHLADIYNIDLEVANITVTDGAKMALYTLFQVILEAGDEVIIPTPYWVSYGEQVKLAEGVPVFAPAKFENHYKITVEDLEEYVTEKTQAIIINSPSNPTGMIYTKEELTLIGLWALKHKILVISDDIYGRLVYNGNQFTALASISEEIKENTMIINGVSKSYSMTGWRIGFAAGNQKIISAMNDIMSHSTSNPSAVAQYASLEAFSGTQEPVEKMRQAFEERLNEMYPKLLALPGFQFEKPQGAFYFFPNIRETLELTGYANASDFANDLLDEEHVAVVTGGAFGAPDNIRMSYAADIDTLHEAVDRIARFIENKRIK